MEAAVCRLTQPILNTVCVLDKRKKIHYSVIVIKHVVCQVGLFFNFHGIFSYAIESASCFLVAAEIR